MNFKDLFLFLVLEIFSALTAVLSFKYIPSILPGSRLAPILVAGLGFLIVGTVVVIKTWKWKDKFTTMSFWTGHAHLWLGSLPMVTHRLIYWSDFSHTTILGIPTSQFHIFSTYVFYALFIGTLLDLVRHFFQKKVF